MNDSPRKPPRRRPNTVSRPRGEHLTEDEIDRLQRAAARMGIWGHRNSTLILIGHRHGLRASELVDLRWEYIDLDRKTIYIRRLKGSKSGEHTLERDEVAALRKLGPEPSGPVFKSERHGPLSRRTLCHIVAQAGELARLPMPVHPHMLRHTCGYLLTLAGHPTRLIQEWLGHRNIQHTVRYSELDPDRFRQVGMWSKKRA